MSGNTRREPDDALARPSGQVSEDFQPVATDLDAVAHGGRAPTSDTATEPCGRRNHSMWLNASRKVMGDGAAAWRGAGGIQGCPRLA